MKAFIYVGGDILPENITEHPKSGDLRIAADSGYNNALRLGERVDLVLGDFDSLGISADSLPRDIEKISLPCEKDETDTQAAVSTALARGADDIVIVGGLSGRLDHTLSNLAILEAMWNEGVHCLITDGYNRVRFIRSTSTLLPKSGFDYLSLVAADDLVRGVSVEGCKYPLKNAKLSRSLQFAVSNEISGNCALVSVRKGALFIVESKNR